MYDDRKTVVKIITVEIWMDRNRDKLLHLVCKRWKNHFKPLLLFSQKTNKN